MLATADATEPQPGATIDWAEMRALYCKGISLSDLSRKFGINLGTIKARSSREKWRNTVAKVNEHVLQTATDDLTVSARHWIGRIDKLMHTGLAHVEERVAKGHTVKTSELVQLMDAAEKANRIARLNYGLDKQDGAVHVHAHLLVRDQMQPALRPVLDVDATVLPDLPALPDEQQGDGVGDAGEPSK